MSSVIVSVAGCVQASVRVEDRIPAAISAVVIARPTHINGSATLPKRSSNIGVANSPTAIPALVSVAETPPIRRSIRDPAASVPGCMPEFDEWRCDGAFDRTACRFGSRMVEPSSITMTPGYRRFNSDCQVEPETQAYETCCSRSAFGTGRTLAAFSRRHIRWHVRPNPCRAPHRG